MKRLPLTFASIAMLSLAVTFSLAQAGEPPELLFQPWDVKPPAPLVTPPVYIKKVTWHESLRASLEATFRTMIERDRAARPDGFVPAIVKLTADAQPVRLEFDLDGVERVVFATLGQWPEHGKTHFLQPRLFDKQGNSIELKLDNPMMEGNADRRAAKTVAVTVDGTAYRGFVVGPREVNIPHARSPGEVSFKLDAEYKRLEVFVYYKPEQGLPPHAAVDCEPTVVAALERRRVRSALWDLVARDFRDRESQIEMEMERREDIWGEYTTDSIGADNNYYLARGEERLALARRTLAFVERTAPRPEMAAELRVLEQRMAREIKDRATAPGRELFAEAVDLRRRIIFSHPATNFERLLLTKRPPPSLSAPGDNYYGIHNSTGPGLVVLDQWKADRPSETALLEGKLPAGCAMHPDLSFDGRRVAFAYADHTPRRERWQFFLYEINVDGTGLRQITGRDDDPMTGAGGRMTVLTEDYDPCYLPDGGIAFISTRNQGGVRCHHGERYCPTYLLYRCEADGSNIRQLSFGEANEWDPMVMPDGRILWTRWDYINRPVIPTLGLWTTWPNGTAAAHYFGNYTPNPCRISQARPIPGSHKLVATTSGCHTMHAGALILVDRKIAEDGMEAITRLTPEATFPETEPNSPVSFSTPYPLSEDLFLAAYCPEPFAGDMVRQQRPNGYGIYLVDTLGGRELIYRDPEISCFAPMPVEPRKKPPVSSSPLPSLPVSATPSQASSSLASLSSTPLTMASSKSNSSKSRSPKPESSTTGAQASATGVFHLQDVYESTQDIPRGTIERLRVNEIIPQPSQRVPYSSHVRFEVLKRILGTVPVDGNGSVSFEAPAGVPLQFQALDKDGMAVMTMRTFTHLQAGEQATCIGCHESRSSSPAAHLTPVTGKVLKLEPPVGPKYEGGLSFAKTVQPVLDRYCIDCHGLEKTDGNVNLLGTIESTERNIANTFHRLLPSTAYTSLTRDGRLVKIAPYHDETWYSQPKDYFAHGGTLAKMLFQEGHEGIELDAESRQRIVNWLDLNAQFYGTYSWNKDEWRQVDPEREESLRTHIRQRFGAKLAAQPFAALLNIALPSESRILKAPLASAAGGWGQIDEGGWKRNDDPNCQKMRRLVQAAIQPSPYQDIAGTCGRDEDCKCLSCWVRKVKEERQRRLAAPK